MMCQMNRFGGLPDVEFHLFRKLRGILNLDRYSTNHAVNRTSMNHQLGIQRSRLIAERKGWRSLKKNARNSAMKKGEVYPGAVAVRPDHTRIAVELERTLKANDRYPGILSCTLDCS